MYVCVCSHAMARVHCDTHVEVQGQFVRVGAVGMELGSSGLAASTILLALYILF